MGMRQFGSELDVNCTGSGNESLGLRAARIVFAGMHGRVQPDHAKSRRREEGKKTQREDMSHTGDKETDVSETLRRAIREQAGRVLLSEVRPF